MIALDDYEKVKRQVAAFQSRHDQIVGAIKQLTKRLKADYGCLTLKEAQRLLETLKGQELQQARTVAKAMRRFKKKWAVQLKEGQ